MERKMFDTPILPRLASILAEVKSGDLVVPAFQRPFVWDDDRRLSLLDSISQGMPIGSLLVWRTERRDLVPQQVVGGIRLAPPKQVGDKIAYLIDGHQRVSTLFGALQQGNREENGEEQGTRWPIYYELGVKQRPAFRIAVRRREPPRDWLPLNILFDGDKLFDFTQELRSRGKRDLARHAENLANIFRDYIIPIVPLVTEELDTVTDAFVRINTQGKGMSEAHMLRALTHLKDTDTERRFAELRARLQGRGWGNLDEQVLVNILKAMLGLDVYSSGARRVHDLLAADQQPLDALGAAVEEALDALYQVGVRGPASLPYAYQLVSLAAVAARSPGSLRTDSAAKKVWRWFWKTTYEEHFTGITGNRIRDAIDDLAALLEPDASGPGLEFDVEPLESIWLPAVRSRAFLLFLAGLPKDPVARDKRRRLLGLENHRTPQIFPQEPAANPANRVIASPEEVRTLRDVLESGRGLTPELADEFAIPEAAARVLPDRDAFLKARLEWLVVQEREFTDALRTP